MTSTTPSTASAKSRPPSITDSPWFWAYLFSTMALIVLFLMNTKYQNRQGHLEREYRYGTRTLARPPGATMSNPQGFGSAADDAVVPVAAGSSPHGDKSLPSANASQLPPTGDAAEPQQGKLLISLVPLRILAGVAMVVSWIGMRWSMFRRRMRAQAEA